MSFQGFQSSLLNWSRHAGGELWVPFSPAIRGGTGISPLGFILMPNCEQGNWRRGGLVVFLPVEDGGGKDKLFERDKLGERDYDFGMTKKM